MKFYLVRHGESEGNVKNIHQNAETGLSEIGIFQAKMVAHRFSKISIDVILSSDYVRTRQTALEISKITNKKVEISNLLREFLRPKEMIGKRIDDPELEIIKQELRQHENDPDWHFSTEENFFDFYQRAKKCLVWLEKRKEENVAVVSHGLFLAMLVSSIIFKDELSPDIFRKMCSQLHTKNTGITICEFGDEGWRLKTWNDYAHLG